MAGAEPRRRNRRTRVIALLLATFIAALPIIGVLVAGNTASALGCHLDEGSPHPCPFLGHDLGELLYALGVMGWMMLVTGPFLLVLMAVWVVWGLTALLRRIRRG